MTQPKNAAFDAIIRLHIPRYRELPDIGFYLEQMLNLVNETLEPLGSEPITGAMISNYIKNKAVPAPEKKKYYREHLAHIFVTCILKQVFSVQQIAAFFDVQKASYPLGTAYDYFCAELENALREAFLFTGQALPAIETRRTDETILMRALVLAVSNRIYAEKALDALLSTCRK